MRKYRFHQLGLYHLPTAKRFYPCAYTQKIIKLSQMLMSLGHEVFLYGPEGADSQYFTKHFATHTLQDIRDDFGSGDNRFELGYDWEHNNNTFRFDEREPLSFTHLKYLDNAIKLINANKQDNDFLLMPQGLPMKSIMDAVKIPMSCEPGIGYESSIARFRAFESSFIQNFTYGKKSGDKYPDGNFYDRVIPNYFEDSEFPWPPTKSRGDYFLYVGRIIARKGVHIAQRVCEQIGAKLIVAGQVSEDLSDIPNVEYVGVVGPKRRHELMSQARAVFVPTIYLEPFGGVNVEAQLCGTPVIATNFGAFPETVVHGKTGFLCLKFSEFVEATKKVDSLDRSEIRKHAEKYLMSNVRHQYQEWFDSIFDLVQEVKKGNASAWYKS